MVAQFQLSLEDGRTVLIAEKGGHQPDRLDDAAVMCFMSFAQPMQVGGEVFGVRLQFPHG